MRSHRSFSFNPTSMKNLNSVSHSVQRKIFYWLPLVVLMASLGVLILGQPRQAGQPIAPTLSVEKILAFAKATASIQEIQDMPDRVQQFAFEESHLSRKNLVAFEEQRLFVYAVNESPSHREGHGSSPMKATARFVRRIIFLKPSIFVVDDEISGPQSSSSVAWMLYSRNPPEISGHRSRFADKDGVLFCETLLPEKSSLKAMGIFGSAPGTDRTGLRIDAGAVRGRTRFLNVIFVNGHGIQPSQIDTKLSEKGDQLELTLSTGKHVFHLSLPPFETGAGEIAIAGSDGNFLLDPRPFPTGLLPYGPKGMRMLESWNDSYRGGNRPAWDAGRPSGELQRVVEQGIVRACRAVDLGCGSGTDAIYLASKGFEVTAIDIAPAALSQGKQKAEKAGVKVRWLLADVLAVPNLEPFDFIFDRGCYHEVRFQGANAYIDTVGKLSRSGTHFLLLAGNPNELTQKYSPPQVTEEEIRADFSPLFNFDWIGETRFETSEPQNLGPLAWSVMMHRKK
jgi:SAM-dependent methyltransferase